jgi:hypothetical protein
MSRHVKTALDSDLGSSSSHSPETPFAPTPTRSMVRPKGSVVLYDPLSQEVGGSGRASASSAGSVVLFSPYAQERVVSKRPGGSVMISSPSMDYASETESGASKALRVVQLVLLASVAVIIWFMLRML